jgi:hypothetical protein
MSLAFLGLRDRRRLETLAARQRTTPDVLAREAVRLLIATFTPGPRPPRGMTVRPSVRPSVQAPCQAPRSRPDVTRETPAPAAPARTCVACGEPLPPQGRGRPRVRHQACGGKTSRTTAPVPPPPRVLPEDEFEVVWDGTQGRQGKSLVGELTRTGCSLSQP